jgi:hypothetical protein
MLKGDTKWVDLTAEERLFLLAIKTELPRVDGTAVRWDDVEFHSGLGERLMEVAETLRLRGLIQIDFEPVFFQFCGGAVTPELCGIKFRDFMPTDGGSVGSHHSR